jgi:hypothetical protein
MAMWTAKARQAHLLKLKSAFPWGPALTTPGIFVPQEIGQFRIPSHCRAPKARDFETQLERIFQRRLRVRELRHLAVRVARKLHRTSPDSCAKRDDLIKWLIVDFACTEPLLREIASKEKSAIE